MGEVAFGAVGSDPRSWPDSAWATATYDTDVGNNDEYQGQLAPTVPGQRGGPVAVPARLGRVVGEASCVPRLAGGAPSGRMRRVGRLGWWGRCVHGRRRQGAHWEDYPEPGC